MPVAAHLGAPALVWERQVTAYLFQHYKGQILGAGQHSRGVLVSRQAPECAASWCWTFGCGSRNARPFTDRIAALCHFCFIRLVVMRLVGGSVLGEVPVSCPSV